MVPPKPTVTKILFPWVTLLRVFDVPEVLEVQVVPSDEVRMVPESPTETYDLVEVVVVVVVVSSSSVSLAHEKIVRLKQEISNMCKNFFIVLPM